MEGYHIRDSLSSGANPDIHVRIERTTTLPRTTGYINPYAPPLPAIGRLLDLIWSHGPKGTLIETSSRDRALAIGCSAGLIPQLLDRLEADGYITSVPHTRGTLIEVLR